MSFFNCIIKSKNKYSLSKFKNKLIFLSSKFNRLKTKHNYRYDIYSKFINKSKLYNQLSSICKTNFNVSAKKYCTFKIGGTIKLLCSPNSIVQCLKLFTFLDKNCIPYYIIGNGSNIVFEDGIINKVIICMNNLNKIYNKNNSVFAYAGVNLFLLNNFCKQNSLSGLEFSFGIPGSIGGAVVMNAGAYGGEFKDVVKYVWIYKNYKIYKLKNSDLNFGYRDSIFKHSKMIILKVQLNLSFGDKNKIECLQKEYMNKRLQSQPLSFPSAGSVFKKCKNESAGKYIDKVGLKSVKIGDIQISSKHANFFINLGNGTCENLKQLIKLTTTVVKQKENVTLQPEIIIVQNNNY